MSDKKTIIGDKMIQAQLEENSKKLGISIDELIDRYIKRGLYSDDYYMQPKLSREELDELSKKEVLSFIDQVNFNTKPFLEQDYRNFKKYILQI